MTQSRIDDARLAQDLFFINHTCIPLPKYAVNWSPFHSILLRKGRVRVRIRIRVHVRTIIISSACYHCFVIIAASHAVKTTHSTRQDYLA